MRKTITTLDAEQARRIRNIIATNVVGARRYLSQRPMYDFDRALVKRRIAELQGMQDTLLALGTTELNGTLYNVIGWLERKLMHSY